MKRQRQAENEAARRVRDWDAAWQAFIHAKQTGDRGLERCARRAIADFDRRTGSRPIAGL